jgi:hypothetical protein
MADQMGRERAEQLVHAWDSEAYRRGIGRLSPGYWTQAEDWILSRGTAGNEADPRSPTPDR